MTQEEKQLLLKDLCARLPYGVKFALSGSNGSNIYTMKGIDLIVTDEGDWEYAVTAKGIEPIEIVYIKPYLHPMSSMTKEEADEFKKISDELLENGENTEIWDTVVDWLNAHRFDHRGLIEKGLAIEVTEENNPYK